MVTYPNNAAIQAAIMQQQMLAAQAQNNQNINIYSPGQGTAGLGTLAGAIPPLSQAVYAPHAHTLTAPVKKISKRLFTSPFIAKLRELSGSGRSPEKCFDGMAYFIADQGKVMEVLGDVRPTYKRRPKFFTQCLLNAAASDQKATSQTSFVIYTMMVNAGLAFSLPPIPRRKKRSYRLTTAGVRLLEHWADKNPSFAPFFNAYVSKEARKEISLVDVDMAMGMEPAVLTKINGRIEAFFKKEMEEKIERQKRNAEALAASEYKSNLKKLYEKASRTVGISMAQPKNYIDEATVLEMNRVKWLSGKGRS